MFSSLCVFGGVVRLHRLCREICSLPSQQDGIMNSSLVIKDPLNTYHLNYIVQILLARFPDTHVQIQSHEIGLGKCLFSQIPNGTPGILCFTPLCLSLESPCWESTDMFDGACSSYEKLRDTEKNILYNIIYNM